MMSATRGVRLAKVKQGLPRQLLHLRGDHVKPPRGWHKVEGHGFVRTSSADHRPLLLLLLFD